jgi:uncharacterized DUF497 family protein
LKITECLWIDKFVDKIIGKHRALVISARDMSKKERKRYGKK